jgi:hypothetical protein
LAFSLYRWNPREIALGHIAVVVNESDYFTGLVVVMELPSL